MYIGYPRIMYTLRTLLIFTMKSTCIELRLHTGVAIRLPGRLYHYVIFEVIVFGVLHLFPLLLVSSVVNLH